MELFFAFMIGVAVNLDNFLIGMNLGIRGQKLTFRSNLIIGLTTGICAFTSAYAASLLSGNLLTYTNITGALLLIFFGIYCLVKGFKDGEPTEEISIMTLRETILLGIILAINCIPPSISAGIMKLSPFHVSLFSALLSCICMHTSNRLGNELIHFHFLRYLTPASSILLIVIGASELFL